MLEKKALKIFIIIIIFFTIGTINPPASYVRSERLCNDNFVPAYREVETAPYKDPAGKAMIYNPVFTVEIESTD